MAPVPGEWERRQELARMSQGRQCRSFMCSFHNAPKDAEMKDGKDSSWL